MTGIFGCTVWFLAAVASVAAGDEAPAEFEPFGQFRYSYSHQQPFPLDAAGTKTSVGWTLDNRLDAGLRWRPADTFELEIELGVFDGQVAGDLTSVGPGYRDDARLHLDGWDLAGIDVRQAMIRWRLPWFAVLAGHQYSNFGFGILANDGRPRAGRFGLPEHGDISDRLLLATRPFAALDSWASKLVLALGGGVVYRDENCSLRDGDVGGEIVGTLFYRTPGLEFGTYVAGRIQDDDDGTFVHATALDFFGSLEPPEGTEGLVLGAEMVLLVGSTNRTVTIRSPDSLKISALGAVARAGWQFGWQRLRAVLEVGYASGDADPYDDVVTSFSFDPDYNVGLVWFDLLLPAIGARAAEQVADPERVGYPPPGIGELSSSGKVTNTFYLFPTVTARPLEQLGLIAGLLVPFSSTQFYQVYQSFESGGVPVNPYGKPEPGRYLGIELDLGADWRQPLWRDIELVAGVQAGWFFPGDALEMADGSKPGITARLLAWLSVEW